MVSFAFSSKYMLMFSLDLEKELPWLRLGNALSSLLLLRKSNPKQNLLANSCDHSAKVATSVCVVGYVAASTQLLNPSVALVRFRMNRR